MEQPDRADWLLPWLSKQNVGYKHTPSMTICPYRKVERVGPTPQEWLFLKWKEQMCVAAPSPPNCFAVYLREHFLLRFQPDVQLCLVSSQWADSSDSS